SSFFFFFFFSSRRRHTRSKRDWSSDVCSSDLRNVPSAATQDTGQRGDGFFGDGMVLDGKFHQGRHRPGGGDLRQGKCRGEANIRSEERRVGKECRSEWETGAGKKNSKKEGMHS